MEKTHDEKSSTSEDVAAPHWWSKNVDNSGAAGGLAHLPEPWARHRWADVEQAEGQAGPTSKEEPDREAESLRARRLSAGDILRKLLKEFEGNSAATAVAQQLLAVAEVEAARVSSGGVEEDMFTCGTVGDLVELACSQQAIEATEGSTARPRRGAGLGPDRGASAGWVRPSVPAPAAVGRSQRRLKPKAQGAAWAQVASRVGSAADGKGRW